MTTFLGCIADDFTGATDLACLLARSGVRVRVRMGAPAALPQDTADVEVIALKCRTAPVADAVREARDALQWLKAAGAQRFFWKYCSTFDSTADGNIGPVAEALMAELGTHQTIHCPAFPENGRSVFMGHLFVGQQPLAESPMRDHPLTPMRDSNLIRLLASQATQPVGLVDRSYVVQGAKAVTAELSRLADKGVAHVILDAVEQEDLEIIAEACRDMVLMAGGSAVAAPLPKIWRAQGMRNADAVKSITAGFADIGGGAIVLSGSCSSMTRQQVADYIARGKPAFRLDPVSLDQDGPQAALDWLAAQNLSQGPLFYATAEPDAMRAAQDQLGIARAGAIVEEALSRLAVAARDYGARRFVVAGGETSGAVTQALAVAQLDVGSEIAPGVPWCLAQSSDHCIAITLKSGNFGTVDFFAKALQILDEMSAK